MPTVRNMNSDRERASVLFGRQGVNKKKNAEKSGEKKAKGGSCFDGCLGFLAYPVPPSDDSPSHYAAQKPLQPLPDCLPWASLPEDKRCGLRVEVGTHAKEGNAGWINQDATSVCCVGSGSASGELEYAFFGVFDGHGRSGHDASQTAAARVPGHLADGKNELSNPKKALEYAFKKADDDVFDHLGPDVEYSGTTGVGVMMDMSSKVLHVANVGDSRAVLGQKSGASWVARPLTEDLKADLASESERITMHGGYVSAIMDDGEPIGPARVWENALLEKPGLAVSRSIGDGCARSIGVIPDPVVTKHVLGEQDRFLLLATDGLWDSMGNDKAVQIAAKFLHMPHIAMKALAEAVRREEGGMLVDDTTIVMVIF